MPPRPRLRFGQPAPRDDEGIPGEWEQLRQGSVFAGPRWRQGELPGGDRTRLVARSQQWRPDAEKCQHAPAGVAEMLMVRPREFAPTAEWPGAGPRVHRNRRTAP